MWGEAMTVNNSMEDRLGRTRKDHRILLLYQETQWNQRLKFAQGMVYLYRAHTSRLPFVPDVD
jgi:hypothetical protein